SFVFMLVGVWILSKIIDFLATNFGGQRNELKATQTAIYSATAGWLAGLFAILPALMVLSLLGLYSIYLLDRGLPRLMKAPNEKAGIYTAAVMVCAIVIGIVLSTVTAAVSNALPFGAGRPFAHHADPNATISIPGLGEVKQGDLNKLETMAKNMEAGKNIPALPTDTLKSLLPETLPGGFTRTAMSTGSGGAMGFSGATAEGVYTSGDSSIQLSVVDMAGAGALMGMASAFGVEASQETETSYSKTGKVDGRMTIEEADKTAKTASYSVVVSDRIALSAEGQNVTGDDVKRAISAIGIPRVEALVKNAPKG
ncbi:MAG: Yip1 family protein, partial [Caulobacterales bacterium]